MTYKTQTLRVAALMLALVTLTALHATAQTGKIDDDLQRAQAILNELASGSVDQASLQLMEAEIARIEAHDYVVETHDARVRRGQRVLPCHSFESWTHRPTR